MSDRMTPIPFEQLMNWILTEKEKNNTVFGVHKNFHKVNAKTLTLFGEKLETPFGPAAGPHTQLAQNIIASYYAGSRFFELKTVQTLDGEDLPVSKPCIKADDEGYNVEWSTELTVQDALGEYIKAWVALKLLSKEWKLGDEEGFIFNMSVGYDLEGIKSPKIDSFIEGLKNAEDTEIWRECKTYIMNNMHRFRYIDEAYLEQITPVICTSITLSTLHGCPPEEIERIATYLIQEKHLNTFIKCNPTLLGYEFARKTLDSMGYDYIVFDDHHFLDDLQFGDAVPMIQRLLNMAKLEGVSFGVKLTNTFPVNIAAGELPGDEMYMSGRPLYPLTIALCYLLSKEFNGMLPISYSGGADAFNIVKLFELGIHPITLATTILKPGGYDRMYQIANELEEAQWRLEEGIDVVSVEKLMKDSTTDPHHLKNIKPIPERKMKKKVPLIDCFVAPCREGCPIHQDITTYIQLVGEGKHADALKVIMESNPLPFITGTICSHKCMDKCTRNFYEEAVLIRDVKLEAATKGFEEVLQQIRSQKLDLVNMNLGKIETEAGVMMEGMAEAKSEAKTAIIGGGSAGLAAAYFLARAGIPVTIFEKSNSLGGVVRHVIPEFRIPASSIDKDIQLLEAMGVEVILETEITSLKELKAKGFVHIIFAIGASKSGLLKLNNGEAINALDFLERCKKVEINSETFMPGKNIVIIGGGNTAMDAARAAKRLPGVEKVSLVYRRTKRYMPAAEEELILAKEEGILFMELLSPVSLDDGELQCCKMVLGEPDEKGRRRPIASDQMVNIQADMVVAAVGEQVDTKIFTDNGLHVTEKGYVKIDFNTLETNCEQIYVIGDAVFGPATVVEAIRDASKATDDIIRKSGLHEQHPNLPTSMENLDEMATLGVQLDEKNEVQQEEKLILNNRSRAISKKGILLHAEDTSHAEDKMQFKNTKQAENKRHVKGMNQESNRCLECSTICECCVDVCPNRANLAIQSKNGEMLQIIHIDILCNECGNCESFCPYDSAPYREKFTLFHTIEGFEDSKNQGFLLLENENKVDRKPLSTLEFTSASKSETKGLKNELPATSKTNKADITVKVRLGDKVLDTSLDNQECILPQDIRELIQLVYDEYRYVLLG